MELDGQEDFCKADGFRRLMGGLYHADREGVARARSRRWRTPGWAMALLAGLSGAVTGCGTSVTAVAGSAGSASTGDGLTLADGASGARYVLSVAEGSLEVAEASGAAGGNSTSAGAGPELLDAATGKAYQLAVSRGALTLTQAAGGEQGVAEIGLVDAETKQAYGLAVVHGALTLAPE